MDRLLPITIVNRTSRARFMASLRDFGNWRRGRHAKILFGSLMGLLLVNNGLNVISSYVGRDFMTAVASRDFHAFTTQGLHYVGTLLALTAAATMIRWMEERLGLLWREFLTHRLVDQYIGKRLYHSLGIQQRVPNPDQRIGDDVKNFTATTISFLLLLINATITIIAFSSVLWSISPELFGVAVGYALIGSGVTFWLGRPLIGINYHQLDREAELRADLVQLRENSEFVALAHHEDHFARRLNSRIDAVVQNYRRLIAVNRNLNFFTNGYNWFIQLIPVFVVAPMYIRGEIEFGVITQSTIAFAQLLGGFSLIVTQFQSISSYTAVVARLDQLSEVSHEMDDAPPPPIDVTDGDDGLEFDHLTLVSPDDSKVLIRDLTVTVERGTRLLITGPNEMAKIALFRATALLWDHGSGRIVRPARRCICFLPERPYLPPGTLRQILAAPDCARPPTDERIAELLAALNLRETLDRIGGLDEERDWDDLLSLGELQRFAVMRALLIAPDFVFLDRLETTLDADCLHKVIALLRDEGVSYVAIVRGTTEQPNYDMVLELSGEGPWTLRPATEPVIAETTAQAS